MFLKSHGSSMPLYVNIYVSVFWLYQNDSDNLDLRNNVSDRYEETYYLGPSLTNKDTGRRLMLQHYNTISTYFLLSQHCTSA